MKINFFIGSLTTLVLAVTADFEYNVKTIDDLPDYDRKQDDDPLQYVPINFESKVTLKRLWIPYDKGVYFLEDTTQPPKKSSGGTFRIPARDRLNSSEKSTNKELAKECFGRPGIKATLRRYKSKSSFKSSLTPKKSPSAVFCFNGIQIAIIEKPNTKPHMRFVVDFINSEKKQTIRVIMHPLRQAKDVVNDNHATTNNVLRIDSPIPVHELSQLAVESGSGNEHEQSFTANILWMKKALDQAKIIGYDKKELSKTYTEWYFAGPVIMAREAFNNILRL